jgi:hypothetical protein
MSIDSTYFKKRDSGMMAKDVDIKEKNPVPAVVGLERSQSPRLIGPVEPSRSVTQMESAGKAVGDTYLPYSAGCTYTCMFICNDSKKDGNMGPESAMLDLTRQSDMLVFQQSMLCQDLLANVGLFEVLRGGAI